MAIKKHSPAWALAALLLFSPVPAEAQGVNLDWSVFQNGSSRSAANVNFRNGAALIERVLVDPGTSSDLAGRLTDTLDEIEDLALTDPKAAARAGKQLIGEAAISSMTMALTAARQIQNIQGARLHEYRENPWNRAGSAPAAGFGASLNRVWISGLGQWTRQSDRDGIKGYKADIGGVVLGVDREAATIPGLQIGLSGSFSTGRLKNNDSYSETDIDAATVGLYGSYNFFGGFFIDANAAYGRAEHTAETKLLLGGKKKGDFDSQSYQAGATFGYVYRDPAGFRVTPSVGLQYYRYSQDSWREKVTRDPEGIAVANWFKKADNDVWEAPVKLKAATTVITGTGTVLTPELRLGLVCVLHKPDTGLRMGFVGSDQAVKIYGIDSSRNRFQVGGGLRAQVTSAVDIFVDYDLEFRTGQRAHNAALGLGVDF